MINIIGDGHNSFLTNLVENNILLIWYIGNNGLLQKSKLIHLHKHVKTIHINIFKFDGSTFTERYQFNKITIDSKNKTIYSDINLSMYAIIDDIELPLSYGCIEER